MRIHVAVYVMAGLLTGFQGSPTEVSSGVAAYMMNGHLIVYNGSADTIYYGAFERESLALIDWGPYCSPVNAIPPFQYKDFSITDESFIPSSVAVVYWWRSDRNVSPPIIVVVRENRPAAGE